MAYNAKNIHFEKSEPAFLRKLRGEHGSDRSNVQIARPKKARLETGDDDGPTIVDEDGESISKEEYEAMTDPVGDAKATGRGDDARQPGQAESTGRAGASEDAGTEKETESKEAQKVADIGAPRKRKQVKVVGDDVEDIEVRREVTKPKPEVVKSKTTSNLKARKKKVKLSFDEPDG